MTVGDWALIALALFVIAGGGLWLWAWWQTRHERSPDKRHDGE